MDMATTDTAILDTTDTGTTMERGRLRLHLTTDTMATMDMVITDTAISDTTDTGTTMARGKLTLSPTTGTDTMDTMDMDTVISTARGKLMPLLITMDTMAMDMDTDTTDMDIMVIMDTSSDKELKSLRVENTAAVRLCSKEQFYAKF